MYPIVPRAILCSIQFVVSWTSRQQIIPICGSVVPMHRLLGSRHRMLSLGANGRLKLKSASTSVRKAPSSAALLSLIMMVVYPTLPLVLIIGMVALFMSNNSLVAVINNLVILAIFLAPIPQPTPMVRPPHF